MKNFELSPLAAFPRFNAAARPVLGAVVAAVYAFVVFTAGPGNGYQEPRPVNYVKLPTVVVIGYRQAAPQAIVASAAVNNVNLTR
ncbi:hypothetical protein [Ramlibacter albus]|uniref:Uncharacterized protein n=1 Tax=Ramlibacter albus TaxID=2079448 RepID=A0A923M6N6_9BURK|nr:hypothetical protein [Ramlibacter albus]MBC5763888.1 hypothetical protein [Ramlibacter albus]